MIVSIKKHEQGRKSMNNISLWTKALLQARVDLHVRGFRPVEKGGALHTKARSYYDSWKATGGFIPVGIEHSVQRDGQEFAAQ